ncbi:hypothetical protein F4778DRAFT_177033 [Xylariomycetidae sp. FL2044]|nr:hypothetical protein F4778DRAFT_177033 [Xylariomycetidae sp. FL2044]
MYHNQSTASLIHRPREDLQVRHFLQLALANQARQAEEQRQLLDKINLLCTNIQNLQLKVDQQWFELRRQSQNIQSIQQKCRNTNSQVAVIRRTNEATARFPLFRHLPLELRRMIWELAIPRGTLSLNQIDHPHLRPPAIASVCKEAREVVLGTDKTSQRFWHRKFGNLQDRSRGWFDATRDTLCIPRAGEIHLSPHDMVAYLNQCPLKIAQNIAVWSGSQIVVRPNTVPLCVSPLRMPSARAISFMMAILPPQIFSEPAVSEIRTFGLDREVEVLVDIENVEALKPFVGMHLRQT